MSAGAKTKSAKMRKMFDQKMRELTHESRQEFLAKQRLEKKQIAIKAGISILIIFTLMIFIGKGMLGFFGISVEAFRGAGGIIIFMLGISMLNSKQSPLKHTKEEHKHASEKEDIAIVPLSIPIIAGPGAISSLIVASHAQNDLSL